VVRPAAQAPLGPAVPAGALTPAGLARRLESGGGRLRHLYLHLPFCERICPYCDFSTAVGAGAEPDRFLDDLASEERLLREAGVSGRLARSEGTLYLGGGTPSWFSPDRLRTLLDWVGGVAGREWIEATCEVNPEHADPERLEVLRSGGITRLSLGVQSLEAGVLRRLGRVHAAGQVRAGTSLARRLGFDLSIDVIFAVPGQTVETGLADLEGVLALEPDHLSLYGLTWEEGTPFTRRRASGRLRAWEPEAEAEFYQRAVDRLRADGWERYEVSNFARPGKESRHNAAYWSGADYLGLGPSAHSLLAGVRTANAFRLRDWEGRVRAGEVPWAEVEELGEWERARERVLLGLRTAAGFSLDEIPASFREEVRRAAEVVVEQGLAGWHQEGVTVRLALTDRGMLLADEVAVRVAP
jgi:oxygen-independent coproporphyrinogen-3 oxidase